MIHGWIMILKFLKSFISCLRLNLILKITRSGSIFRRNYVFKQNSLACVIYDCFPNFNLLNISLLQVFNRLVIDHRLLLILTLAIWNLSIRKILVKLQITIYFRFSLHKYTLCCGLSMSDRRRGNISPSSFHYTLR